MSFTDERLLDDVRREWPLDGADPDADVRAWRRGTELYEDDDRYDALLRAGDLMAQAVRHHLHAQDVLRDDDLAVTLHSLLFAATTPPPAGGPPAAEALRLSRLALAVVKQHGWQPVALGGNGHIAPELFEDAEIVQVLTAAIAPDELASFFLDARA